MRGCPEEVHGKAVSRRTEISYKAEHPGMSQHNMTKSCDSGETVNEAVYSESLFTHPGRSDRHCGQLMKI